MQRERLESQECFPERQSLTFIRQSDLDASRGARCYTITNLSVEFGYILISVRVTSLCLGHRKQAAVESQRLILLSLNTKTNVFEVEKTCPCNKRHVLT